MQSEPLLALRTDLIAELGENLPDTWEDVHRIGKKLKAKGHPPGKIPHRQPRLQPAVPEGVLEAPHLCLEPEILLCAVHVEIHSRGGPARRANGGAGRSGSVHHSR